MADSTNQLIGFWRLTAERQQRNPFSFSAIGRIHGSDESVERNAEESNHPFTRAPVDRRNRKPEVLFRRRSYAVSPDPGR